MQKLRSYLKALPLAALFVGMLATGAFAQTAEADVSGAISTAAASGLSVISTNMPVVFGVAIAFVAWSVGRRVLGKI